jgi:xanthine dehydrogenase accessory factor
MRLDPEIIHLRISQLLNQRKRFAVATIAEVKGSCPQRPGARMIVHLDGTFEFTIGGGTFEAEVIRDALSLIDQETPAHREYKLTEPEIGMYCQGLVRVMFESYKPRPRLMIFGGGHVGQALSRISSAAKLFEVLVIDDRAEYANRDKHPDVESVILTDRKFEHDVPLVDAETFLVIVTRCHATDKILVERYLDSDCAYLGLIGSSGKIRIFRRELQAKGIPERLLDRMHAPIGIPIGGKDPAEVAVSILAEIIQVKNMPRMSVSLEVTASG